MADLLGQTWRLYRMHFAAVLLIVCMIHLPAAFVCLALGASTVMTNLLTGFADIAITGAVLHYFANKDHVGSSVLTGLRKWPRLFFINFACNLAILIGLVLFIVPGLFLLVRFSLVNPLIMFPTRKMPADVISYSSYLVRTKKLFWPIFWSGLILFLILAAAWLLIFILAGVVGAIVAPESGWVDSVYFDESVSLLFSLIFPIFAALSYSAYQRTMEVPVQAEALG
ncbi:hypothetical protein [Paenibacillus thermotolerans]|uniref:hypothetical protein n=1 Tax=Paenibacillus thermotolerans TaxID=3027807 RepID=UPI002368AFDE|nr:MULTISPECIES: hypothetical protein [unclassified Paenibacillus]